MSMYSSITDPKNAVRAEPAVAGMASGAATPQIATTLQISTGTVRKHLEAVHATLGVSSRAAVAATVMRLVHPEAAGILGQPLLSR